MVRVLVADLRATPQGTLKVSPIYQIPVPDPGSPAVNPPTIFLCEDGTVAGGQSVGSNARAGDNPRWRATFFFTPPAVGQKAATSVRILVTWPALADGVANIPPAKYSGSYEIFTALYRN